jgi:hypothetical protein
MYGTMARPSPHRNVLSLVGSTCRSVVRQSTQPRLVPNQFQLGAGRVVSSVDDFALELNWAGPMVLSYRGRA